ncbi:hypothetical protein D9615_007474 [Tricholomella constricta]|uniref:F-box domain-containing protein n=1 Tax=Tricholomella constricta TaxID=117010 RepID=A0A8H5GYF2_9AGAR|nr:hypothetical protein D9615_007474 [Tricholomella constricta]
MAAINVFRDDIGGFRLTLLHLDDDALSLIASQLLDAPDVADALRLSLVCKRLRTIVLSLLFRAVGWPRRNRIEFYPPSLWPFIRYVETDAGKCDFFDAFLLRRLSFLQVHWRSHHAKALNNLGNALPRLHNLTTFNYSEQKFGPSLASISCLARSSPTLTTLELNTVFFTHDALTSFSEFSGLHRLLLKQPEGTTLLTAPKSKRTLSLQCVSNLVLACRETLSYLEIPGEFCPLEAFATASTKLSSLKALVLHGYPPLDTEIPIWKIFPSMPQLSRLDLLFKLRVIGARLSRYVVMPCEAPIVPGDASVFPSHLETLSIANPMMRDRMFTNLPPSLKSLTLDFVPEWENVLSKDSLAYHRPETMLKFLNSMRKKGSASLPFLASFCMKTGWCATPEILACIRRAFPNLTFLELQGLRYVNRAEALSDMDGCVSSLSDLQSLRTIKLAMELPEDAYKDSLSAERTVGSVEQATRRWAETLALRLTNLQFLAFETRPRVGRGLGQRIQPTQLNWVWFDVRGGIAKHRHG